MKNWLITGISRGLGKALAEAALERGDTVVGTTREGTASITGRRGTLHVLPLDLATGGSATAEAAMAKAFALAGRIDVLVNNAGYGLLGAVEDASDAEAARLFEVDVFGPFRLIRAALPRLRAQGAGHIVNVTSIAGRAPMAGSGLYAAAKGAIEALSDSLAQEVAPLGLHVTAVAPGAFRTDFLTGHSIRKSEAQSRAYATAEQVVTYLDGMNGKQSGDPARAATAMLALVDAEHPPLHLLLGSDALRRTREKLATTTAELEQWAEVTRGTDHV